ncbi:hypothetical protein ACRALDRAFT_1063536 [Sodiomyces alcalophilus JCM 7366]|uniref:uncharacterized protein n=1 Tax=Sodiomyces alcalophilus JCM 7366 TaxID=591952 RepID=UPI0039B437DB
MSPAPSDPPGLAKLQAEYGQLTLAQLQQQKEVMEAKLGTLSELLDLHGVDMSTPLTTRDGFPRTDIDVAEVRITRSQVTHLRNDYKTLMRIFEERLHERLTSVVIAPKEDSGVAVHSSLNQAQQCDGRPFATINGVLPGSPAMLAGLRAADQIIRFSHITHINPDGLNEVAGCVQENEGREVSVEISRLGQGGSRQNLSVRLTPTRHWGGRGLLGCYILPYNRPIG